MPWNVIPAAPEGDLGQTLRNSLKEQWRNWMMHCPHIESLCFADITFFSDSFHNVGAALTIVIVPAKGHNGSDNFRSYLSALKERYVANEHTMAAHEVFASGLPSNGPEHPRPQTAAELNKFYEEIPSDVHVESSFFLDELNTPSNLIHNPDDNGTRQGLFVDEMLPYHHKGKLPLNLSQKVSAEPVCLQWQKWMEVFAQEQSNGNLRSGAGGDLRWLVAIPVGNRNDLNPRDYTLLSCAFLAFDSNLSQSQVYEAIRYVLLHLYEANAAAWAARRGELRGRNLAIIPASHELKNVVEALVPGVSDRAIGLLHSYFHQTLVAPLDIPEPRTQESNPLRNVDLPTLLAHARFLSGSCRNLLLCTVRGVCRPHARGRPAPRHLPVGLGLGWNFPPV